MLAKRLLPALAAVSSVTAQSSTCTVSATTTINSAADATGLASCGAIKGSVVINAGAGQAVDISGPKVITGDLAITNNPTISSLSSTSLQTISGSFTINNSTQLTSLTFSKLTEADTINWQSVPLLASINFGATISTSKSITISDTYLDTLDGIDVSSPSLLEINNNGRLNTFQSSIAMVTDLLSLSANGASFSVSFPNLVWARNISIANVTTFSAPSLQSVNGSMRFDSNKFTNFTASNFTSTGSGDISFIDNAALTNLSFPALTSLGGSLVIANNTALDAINGFPLLKSLLGSIKLRGNFTDIEFPSLNRVQGSFDASSTADIDSSCTTLKKLSKDGGNSDIEGVFSCTSSNSSANSDTGSGTTGSNGGGSSTSSNNGTGGTNNTAAGLYLNHAFLGLAAVGAGGFATGLW